MSRSLSDERPGAGRRVAACYAKIDDTMTRGPVNRAVGIAHETSVVRLFRLRDWPRLICDILLFRVMRFVHLPREGSARTVEMRDGTVLTYRLNRGDIQALREIWLDQVYMPWPEASTLRQVVDLGANIGFTSIYLYRRLTVEYLIAVEPDPDNVRVLRQNLRQNSIPSAIITAAVGPIDGHASFRRDRASNLGFVDPAGELDIRIVSMDSVIADLPSHTAETLLKVDIEGGEEELFAGDVPWLSRFDYLMAELHPSRANMTRIMNVFEAAGLHLRAGSNRGEPVSCWLRETHSQAA